METALAVHTAVVEQLEPVLVDKQRVEVVGAVADAVQPADDRADARTHDVVDGDADLFDHLECAHLGSTFRTAATEHQCYLRTTGTADRQRAHKDEQHK